VTRGEFGALLVHIGYPKTASSWLQRHVFSNARTGFGPLFGSDVVMRREAQAHVVRPGPFVFDVVLCAKRFHPAVRDVDEAGRVPVLSYERLTGTPHSGGYDSRDVADRLRAVFPGARILMVIREQRKMIASAYRQYVRNGAVGSVEAYLDPPSDGRLPGFRFEFFEYHRLFEYYAGHFGSENVLVIPYELFAVDPREFVRRCLVFARLPAGDSLDGLPYHASENPGLSGFALFLKRTLSRVCARPDTLNPHVMIPLSRRQELALERLLFRLDRVVPRRLGRALEHRLADRIASRVGDRYQTSNQMLAASASVDLRRFGYDLPS
jgi:hypothetical protein